MWNGFSDAQKDEMARTGRVELPSDYDDGPYVITQKLIEDGREQLVLRAPLDLPFPVRVALVRCGCGDGCAVAHC